MTANQHPAELLIEEIVEAQKLIAKKVISIPQRYFLFTTGLKARAADLGWSPETVWNGEDSMRWIATMKGQLG